LGAEIPAASSSDDPEAASSPVAPAARFTFAAESFPVEDTPASERPANVSLFPELLPSRAAPLQTAGPAVEFTGAPCLQIHGSFILVAVRGGFLLVNQRAAHERILYEKALEDLRRPGRFSAQQLLFPELVEFSGVEARAVDQHLAELRTLGFDLEPFGPNAFQLRGSPADVAPEKAQEILQGVTGRLIEAEGGRRKEGPEELPTRVAKAYARAAAIPLDAPLDAARMGALVDGLFATQNPYVTPTGLPVLIRYSLDEIRRRFGLKPEDA
jgi:DNA mismatch repair protein MutL